MTSNMSKVTVRVLLTSGVLIEESDEFDLSTEKVKTWGDASLARDRGIEYDTPMAVVESVRKNWRNLDNFTLYGYQGFEKVVIPTSHILALDILVEPVVG